MNSNIKNSFHYDAYYEWEENNEGNNHHDDGEYVLEMQNKDKELNSHSDKSRHKKSESGVYDELDYDLSPRTETHSQNQILADDLENCAKHKKIAVILIIAIALIASVVAGVVYATYGKYDQPMELFNSIVYFSTLTQFCIHYYYY